MIPTWLHILAILSLLAGFVSAAIIIADERRRPQHMWIMNFVWPLVALFGSGLALLGYYRYGILSTRQAMQGDGPDAETPFWAKVAKGACHCGAGCTLGDILAEWLAFFVPAIAVWLGWQTIFPEKIFAVWVLDYIFAFSLGVIFQYFAIKPMRDLSVGQGIWQAIKADTLSLTSWQVGMYGFMALAHFWFFPQVLGAELRVPTVEFWFTMQIAMLCGFLTAYPVNWWLIRRGIKEEM